MFLFQTLNDILSKWAWKWGHSFLAVFLTAWKV